jgi:hypothetical protein
MPNHNPALEAFVSPFIQERLAICRSCEHYSGKLCKQINDYAASLHNVPDRKCPINKWDIVVL